MPWTVGTPLFRSSDWGSDTWDSSVDSLWTTGLCGSRPEKSESWGLVPEYLIVRYLDPKGMVSQGTVPGVPSPTGSLRKSRFSPGLECVCPGRGENGVSFSHQRVRGVVSTDLGRTRVSLVQEPECMTRRMTTERPGSGVRWEDLLRSRQPRRARGSHPLFPCPTRTTLSADSPRGWEGSGRVCRRARSRKCFKPTLRSYRRNLFVSYLFSLRGLCFV